MVISRSSCRNSVCVCIQRWKRLLLAKANGVLDLVNNGLAGATVDLVVLLTTGLVEGRLGGRFAGIGLNATGNA